MKRLAFWIAILLLALVAALAGMSWFTGRGQVETADQAAPSGGKFVKAADVEIFVQQTGPGDGLPVLFVHGTGAWSEAWRRPMNTLAQDGHRAIAMDLPPFGFSRRPQPPSYAKADQGRRILGVLDALQISSAVLVAHSFGGGPAMEAVLLAPERFQAVVLVDAALAISPEGAESVAPPGLMVRAILAAPSVRDALVSAFLTNPQFTRILLTKFIDDPAKATDEWVEVYRRPLRVEGTTEAVGAWLPTLIAPGVRSASERPASYRALKLPFFVIWGERDSITPLEQAERLARLVPGASLMVMKGVGHIPQIEDPARFDELLSRVIAEASSAASSQ